MSDTNNEQILSRPEVDLFARALYYVATVDGVDKSETALITEFVNDAGYPELIEELESSNFRPEEAAMVLDTTHKRRVLMKALFALVKADGNISQDERLRLFSIADVLGMSQLMDDFEKETENADIR